MCNTTRVPLNADTWVAPTGAEATHKLTGAEFFLLRNVTEAVQLGKLAETTSMTPQDVLTHSAGLIDAGVLRIVSGPDRAGTAAKSQRRMLRDQLAAVSGRSQSNTRLWSRGFAELKEGNTHAAAMLMHMAMSAEPQDPELHRVREQLTELKRRDGRTEDADVIARRQAIEAATHLACAAQSLCRTQATKALNVARTAVRELDVFKAFDALEVRLDARVRYRLALVLGELQEPRVALRLAEAASCTIREDDVEALVDRLRTRVQALDRR